MAKAHYMLVRLFVARTCMSLNRYDASIYDVCVVIAVRLLQPPLLSMYR